MADMQNRREILKLMGLGGVVFASSLLRATTGCSSNGAGSNGASSLEGGEPIPNPPTGTPRGAMKDFFFLQISDTHWGFTGPKVNPEPTVELPNIDYYCGSGHEGMQGQIVVE